MMAANDNVDVMYEVWWESGADDFLIAIFPNEDDALDYLNWVGDDDHVYYIEEAEYGE